MPLARLLERTFYAIEYAADRAARTLVDAEIDGFADVAENFLDRLKRLADSIELDLHLVGTSQPLLELGLRTGFGDSRAGYSGAPMGCSG